MRPLVPLALAGALSACASHDAPEPQEAPRAAVELLVERFSRAGERSFYTMSPDGSRVLPFDAAGPDALLVAPSPDGRTLAVLRPANGLVHLWLVDRHGGGASPVLEGTRIVHSVSWSPDGGRLVLAQSTETETQDIWVVNRDGSGAIDLTPDPLPGVWFDSTPAFSPDGARIAFASNRGGVTQIFTMNADGTDPAPLVPAPILVRGTDPAWSPDGGRVAFAAATPDTRGIAVVRADGGGYRFFPVAPFDAGRVAWSPDGRVLFTTNASGDYEVLALDPADGATENLTNHRAHDFRVARLPFVAPPRWRGLGAPVRHAAGAEGAPAIAVGDVAVDGVPDLLALAPARSQVRLLIGIGGGDLAPAGGLDAGPGLRALAAADLGADRTTDVIALGASSLAVWPGGPGGPGAPTEHAIPGEARGLAVTDLDDDGSPDLAAVYDGGEGFHVRVHGTGVGGGPLVAILDVATGFAGAGQATACDVTGEGAGDLLVVTDRPGAAVVLLPGHGDISLAEPAVAAAGLAVDRDAALACADLDGDRRADLVLFEAGVPGGLLVLRSAGAALGAPERLRVGGISVVAADVDRDGDADLLAADPARPEVLLLRNLTDGRFAPAVAVPVGGAPLRLAVADLDLDGWPDLVVADADGSVAVLPNLGREAP